MNFSLALLSRHSSIGLSSAARKEAVSTQKSLRLRGLVSAPMRRSAKAQLGSAGDEYGDMLSDDIMRKLALSIGGATSSSTEVLWEIFQHPTHGRSMRARKDIPRGTCIIHDPMLLSEGVGVLLHPQLEALAAKVCCALLSQRGACGLFEASRCLLGRAVVHLLNRSVGFAFLAGRGGDAV